jgi:hypothetical protein
VIELGFDTQKNLRIDLVLDRDREEDRLEGRRLRFETECFMKRDFASGVQSTWKCTAGVFLGYAMIFNEVKDFADGWESGQRLRSLRAPDARRDGGKRWFFPRGDFRTEIAILFYI